MAGALEGLGFSASEAEATAAAVLADDPALTAPDALRLALKTLGAR